MFISEWTIDFKVLKSLITLMIKHDNRTFRKIEIYSMMHSHDD